MSHEDIRGQVMELMSQKDKIENEIKELTAVLTQSGVGMKDPLVDSEGYPINSINVYQIRHARHRIICLQNDHKEVMKRIESGLHGYYATTSTELAPDRPAKMDIATEDESVVYKTPFARITVVSDNSPAYFADFQVNDELVEFGSVNASNFKSVTDIATVVQHSEGNKLNVKLKRGNRFLVVQLTPRKWLGRGLLGCNIAPL
ncbi:unnamed protein product [Psylliodes chrysocephalus]|uniref:26S proteasome non-ATPase regulatory subunit 9 n=1 Tax=Psylliodes chrysocephalus TaxID=3402493 RepID=A0A9P0CKW9_9CUCU|nr:unnamed protein product [Psylliodes chrysocephala]